MYDARPFRVLGGTIGFGQRRYSGNGWEALEMRYCYNKGKVTHKSLVALRVPTALHA